MHAVDITIISIYLHDREINSTGENFVFESWPAALYSLPLLYGISINGVFFVCWNEMNAASFMFLIAFLFCSSFFDSFSLFPIHFPVFILPLQTCFSSWRIFHSLSTHQVIRMTLHASVCNFVCKMHQIACTRRYTCMPSSYRIYIRFHPLTPLH